jgi:hypothetical protein
MGQLQFVMLCGIVIAWLVTAGLHVIGEKESVIFAGEVGSWGDFK